MNKTKYLNTLDPTQLYDDVEDKKAYPELVLKQNILNAQDIMLISERKLMNNFRTRGRYYKPDLVDFEGNIILLFGFIKNMILDKSLATKEDQRIYSLLLRAERGEQFNALILISFKNFLLNWLHKINITNLFIQGGQSFKDELEEDFG